MKWVEIKEFCPEFGVPVIVYGERTTAIARLITVTTQMDGKWFEFYDGFTSNDKCWFTVTHWMPLPEPPK